MYINKVDRCTIRESSILVEQFFLLIRRGVGVLRVTNVKAKITTIKLRSRVLDTYSLHGDKLIHELHLLRFSHVLPTPEPAYLLL